MTRSKSMGKEKAKMQLPEVTPLVFNEEISNNVDIVNSKFDFWQFIGILKIIALFLIWLYTIYTLL